MKRSNGVKVKLSVEIKFKLRKPGKIYKTYDH